MIKMKQTLSIIVVIFTLIFPSLSWGNVDGKGLICGTKEKLKYGYIYPSFYIFEFGYVFNNGIMEKDGIIVTTEGMVQKYETTTSIIRWKIGDLISTLDRKSLVLQSRVGEGELNHQCKVFTKEDLIEEVNKLVKMYQTELEKSISENKI